MNEADRQGRIEELRRAELAKAIVENPLWSELWAQLDERLMSGWKSSVTGQSDVREMIYLQMRAAESVRAEMESILMTGTMARLQLERSEDGR